MKKQKVNRKIKINWNLMLQIFSHLKMNKKI